MVLVGLLKTLGFILVLFFIGSIVANDPNAAFNFASKTIQDLGTTINNNLGAAVGVWLVMSMLLFAAFLFLWKLGNWKTSTLFSLAAGLFLLYLISLGGG